MKSFLLKCLLFFAIFFCVEKALIFIRNAAPGKELDKRLEWVLNGKIDADVLVLGSSRGARDIIAAQLADSLKTTTYNLSYPGSNIVFHEYLLNKLIQFKNRIPRVLILALDDPGELKANNLINFRFDRLYPLVKYEDVRNSLIEKGEKDRILSDLFIVHQLLPSHFDFRKKHFDNLDTLFSDGSMSIAFKSKDFNIPFKDNYNTHAISQENATLLKSFHNFTSLCKQHNIKLILTLPPNFRKPAIGLKSRIEELAGGNAFVMLYDTTKSVYQDPAVFYDENHLQRNGAKIFTAEMIDYIRKNKLLE